MTSIAQLFFEWIVVWFRGDRIRISPTAGRLLRLQVNDRLLLRGELYRVESREADQDQVTYQLRSSNLDRLTVPIDRLTVPIDRLTVPIDRSGGALATLRLSKLSGTTSDVVIFDDDITVLGAHSQPL
ncbi:MAG: hypothetical protein AB8B91_14335 [Rubripirellula sp.]